MERAQGRTIWNLSKRSAVNRRRTLVRVPSEVLGYSGLMSEAKKEEYLARSGMDKGV